MSSRVHICEINICLHIEGKITKTYTNANSTEWYLLCKWHWGVRACNANDIGVYLPVMQMPLGCTCGKKKFNKFRHRLTSVLPSVCLHYSPYILQYAARYLLKDTFNSISISFFVIASNTNRHGENHRITLNADLLLVTYCNAVYEWHF